MSILLFNVDRIWSANPQQLWKVSVNWVKSRESLEKVKDKKKRKGNFFNRTSVKKRAKEKKGKKFIDFVQKEKKGIKILLVWKRE